MRCSISVNSNTITDRFMIYMGFRYRVKNISWNTFNIYRFVRLNINSCFKFVICSPGKCQFCFSRNSTPGHFEVQCSRMFFYDFIVKSIQNNLECKDIIRVCITNNCFLKAKSALLFCVIEGRRLNLNQFISGRRITKRPCDCILSSIK